MNDLESNVLKEVERLSDETVKELIEVLRVPAISPEYGGEGEYEKAKRILEILEKMGLKVKIINVLDKNKKIRPNIISFLEGRTKNKLWIIAHMDVVPPGDLSMWKTKPFDPVLKNGKIFARGALDDGQAIGAMLLAVKALLNSNAKPKSTVAVVFLSDEETGSRYGIKYLIKKYGGLFSKKDAALVPDAGNEEGTMIETAEKSILWLKIKVKGREVHASTPEKGINAHRIAMEYSLAVDKILHERYNTKQKPFSSISSFEPTVAKNSAQSPNIAPGEHEIVFDCRILPKYKIKEVLNVFEKVAKIFEKRLKVKIEIEKIISDESTKATPNNSRIVKSLKTAIKEVKGKSAFTVGIGGGTIARYLRKIGVPAAVWLTCPNVEHQPNEYCRIKDIVEDAKIMALLMLRL